MTGPQVEQMRAAVEAVCPAEVVTRGDGRQALAYLDQFRPWSQGAPLAIFLDLSMSVESGLEVLRKVKAGPSRRQTPVVVFTASQREVDIYLSYHLGANAYLVKPAEPSAFHQVVSSAARFWLTMNVPAPA